MIQSFQNVSKKKLNNPPFEFLFIITHLCLADVDPLDVWLFVAGDLLDFINSELILPNLGKAESNILDDRFELIFFYIIQLTAYLDFPINFRFDILI